MVQSSEVRPDTSSLSLTSLNPNGCNCFSLVCYQRFKVIGLALVGVSAHWLNEKILGKNFKTSVTCFYAKSDFL